MLPLREQAAVFPQRDRVFLNLVGISKNSFSIQNSRHLFQRKGVVFNGQRGMDGFDPILPPKAGVQIPVREYSDPPDLFADGRNQIGDFVCDVKWWSIVTHVTSTS